MQDNVLNFWFPRKHFNFSHSGVNMLCCQDLGSYLTNGFICVWILITEPALKVYIIKEC